MLIAGPATHRPAPRRSSHSRCSRSCWRADCFSRRPWAGAGGTGGSPRAASAGTAVGVWAIALTAAVAGLGH